MVMVRPRWCPCFLASSTRCWGEQSDHPHILFTDRGPGFYHPSTGTICPQYMEALDVHGFKPWAGDHGKWQPPDLADILLHETAVAWVRKYFKHHPLPLAHQAQEKNTRALKRTLEAAVEHINTFYQVDDLCRSLPKRLKLLVAEDGERLAYRLPPPLPATSVDAIHVWVKRLHTTEPHP